MHENRIHLDGPAGNIEAIMEIPADMSLRGIALVAHPHPIGGGANTNKVAHMLAKTFLSLGYAAFRPNFRGVGMTEGEHDDGAGETDDLMAVLEDAHWRLDDPERRLPVTLAGFSFGAYCQTRLARRLRDAGRAAEWLALVGVAAGFIEGARAYDAEAVPADTLIIHGAADTLVPLANVLTWAEPQNLPVVVIPGADHFFHRRLTLIRDIIVRAWHGRARDAR
ncbi:MAG: alpha/beta hydrolase [Zoogloeaceae bacterium]|jgi:alpha/beta superfamily hydrolase|nr:alpha/beta hydrolase [Zoogloeaceae bacterium]